MEAQTAFDPVSRRAVALGGAPISAVYQGQAYYFETRENRDAFETSPDKYLAGLAKAGQAIGPAPTSQDRPRRHRGC